MKTNKLRTLIPVILVLIAVVGFIAHFATGTLSGFGWRDIAMMCPLGALATMIAAKTIIPRAVVSLVIAAIIFVLFGRAFCGWVCPVPVVSKTREFFGGGKKAKAKKDDEFAKASADTVAAAAGESAASTAELTAEEQALLKGGCGACASEVCLSKRGSKVDSRHIVLIAALVSTLIFGFPVFCIVCPIGLSFASLFLVIQLFAAGEISWLVVVAPLLLLVEVVFFRKWCHRLCPLGALMSLTAKANKTFVPTVDPDKCLESTRGVSCGVCTRVCPEGINPGHMDLSETSWSECIKCRTCVDNCPAGAISMPFLPKKAQAAKEEPVA